MKRILMLVGVVSLFATFGSGAVAGSGKGQLTRQLTGKVTSVTARSITVRSPASSLKCATRAGLRLGGVLGKRARMTCRLNAGKLVVRSVKVIPAKASRASKPSTSQSTAPSSATDPADDDADDDTGDDATGDDDDNGDDDATGDDDDQGDDATGDDDDQGDDATGDDDDQGDDDETGDDDDEGDDDDTGDDDDGDEPPDDGGDDD